MSSQPTGEWDDMTEQTQQEIKARLHDVIADLTDMHEDLAENPAIWTLQARFPRVG